MTASGALFTVGHALDCRKGGSISGAASQRGTSYHYDLAAMVRGQTTKEPVIREPNENSSGTLLMADIGVRGAWHTQARALFDIRVIDTDTKSYVSSTPQAVLKKAEKEKMSRYLKVCEEKHVSFTPLCFSVDGLIGNEAKSFLKRLAERLSEKGMNHSVQSCIGSKQSPTLLLLKQHFYA